VHPTTENRATISGALFRLRSSAMLRSALFGRTRVYQDVQCTQLIAHFGLGPWVECTQDLDWSLVHMNSFRQTRT
jgi:hypothetical protein